MVFPLRDHFVVENRLLDLKIRQMVKKSSKYIENKCSHWALRLILIGKHAHRKGVLDMLDQIKAEIVSYWRI